jgi:nucleoside-diphosphate-sugar epimerase
MAVLITGATGHLGPHLIAELLRAGDFDRIYLAARRNHEPAVLRASAVERTARAQLSRAGIVASRTTIIPIDADRLVLPAGDIRSIMADVSVIVHAAADTRFAAPIDILRTANVGGTLAVCRLAEQCPRLRQLLFVSTACVAGRRTGRIQERPLDDSAGFANAYEQTKWEAEQVVIAARLPARLARLTTCAGSHLTGYVHRFGALHHLLHWMSRGLVPMMPGTAETPIDVMSTDLAAAWIARAAAVDPHGLDVCHVALGNDGVPLAALLDFILPLLDENRRGRFQRPLLVDEAVFQSFSDMVRLSGDALLARVQASAAAVLPSLLHPKVYETTAAERCWGGALPYPDWKSLLSRVIAFGRAQRWGFLPSGEACHA